MTRLRLRGLAVLGLAMLTLVLMSAGSGDARAATTAPVWPDGGALTLPAGAAAPPTSTTLPGIDCSAVGSCFAAGSFTNGSGTTQAMIFGETGGVWGGGVPVAPPSGSASSSLNAIGCTSAGTCTAVGSDMNGSGVEQPIASVSSAGTFGTATEIGNLPSGATGGEFSAVSCSSGSSCAAVGSDNNGVAMADTETAGTWGAAVEVMPPTDAATSAHGVLDGVSCTSPGNCIAVGTYLDTGGQTQAMAAAEIGGKWGVAAAQVAEPSGASGGVLSSVTCPSGGVCAAVGDYVNAGGQTLPTVDTISAPTSATPGTPSTASGLAVPSGTEAATLDSVSCTSSGECVTTGSSVSGGAVAPITASESSNAWTPTSALTVPPGATASAGLDGATLAVDCAGVDGCSAVGTYPVSGGVGAMAFNAHPSLVISTTGVPQATVGKPYNARLSAAGGTGFYSWTLSSGSLPPGLSLGSSGTIYGTPTATAAVGFTVTVQDTSNPPDTASVSLGLAVAPPVAAKTTASKGTGSTTKKKRKKSKKGGGKRKGHTHVVAGAKVLKIAAVAGDTARVKIKCLKESRCTGKVSMVVLEHIRKGKVIKITADARRATRIRLKQITLGSVSYSIRRGRTVKVTIKLDRTGQAMLAAHKKLKVGFALRPTRPKHVAPQSIKQTVTIRIPHKHKHKHKGTHARTHKAHATASAAAAPSAVEPAVR